MLQQQHRAPSPPPPGVPLAHSSSFDRRPPSSASASTGTANSAEEELRLALERERGRSAHLSAQCDVLALSLEEAKSASARVAQAAQKHEANAASSRAASDCADGAVECYDVLVALLETEAALIGAAAAGHNNNCGSFDSAAASPSPSSTLDLRVASANRRSAETVARHLLAKLDRESPNVVAAGSKSNLHHRSRRPRPSLPSSSSSVLDASWEDSSGYSHTNR